LEDGGARARRSRRRSSVNYISCFYIVRLGQIRINTYLLLFKSADQEHSWILVYKCEEMHLNSTLGDLADSMFVTSKDVAERPVVDPVSVKQVLETVK